MVINTPQEAESFVLTYLETHQEFLQVVWQKFPLRKVKRKKKLEMVDEETNKRIGEALSEYKAGNYVEVAPEDIRNHFNAIFQEHVLY